MNYEKVLMSISGLPCFVSRALPQANAQIAFKEWHVAFHGTAP